MSPLRLALRGNYPNQGDKEFGESFVLPSDLPIRDHFDSIRSRMHAGWCLQWYYVLPNAPVGSTAERYGTLDNLHPPVHPEGMQPVQLVYLILHFRSGMKR